MTACWEIIKSALNDNNNNNNNNSIILHLVIWFLREKLPNVETAKINATELSELTRKQLNVRKGWKSLLLTRHLN